MKLHVHFLALLVFGLGSTFLAASCRAEVFDWNNITYAPTPTQATAVTTLTDTAITDNTLSIRYALANGGAFSTTVQSPASASNSTSANVYATSGTASQNSLQNVMNFSGNTATNAESTTVTLFFANPVTNVTFKFFDVDSGTVSGNGNYADVIKNIAGTGFQGGTIYPTTVVGSTDNTVTGSGAGFQATGTASNPQTSSLGDVSVTFGSYPLTQISFTYGDNFTGTPHSNIQIVALSNLTVTTIPEPGTLALVGLGMAGTAVLARRRRR